jgi:hypothetical protein
MTNNLTYFWRESLEECRSTLVTQQVAHDRYSTCLLLKIGILDARFNRIKGRCHCNRRNCPCYRCDKVLRPRRLAIVRYAENIILRNRAGTE